METTDRHEFLPADPSYKKKVLILIILLFGLGAACLNWLIPLFNSYLIQQKPDVALRVIMCITIALLIVPGSFVIYILRIALRTLRQGQFPPTGLKVFKDTRILYDEAARTRAKIIIGLAITVMLLCISIFILIVKLINVSS